MGTLGFPEIIVLLVMVLIYVIIAPLLLSIGLRILVSLAETFGLPEALGRFGATLVTSFGEHRGQNEE